MPLLLLQHATRRTGLVLNEDTIIGRRDESNLVLKAHGVSREHVRISLKAGRCILHDLGSTNGTWVNGNRLVQPHTLVEGDRIQIGETKFVYLQRNELPRGVRSLKRNAVAKSHITFRCPGCQGMLQAPRDFAGRKGKCEHCQTRFFVPVVGGASAKPLGDTSPKHDPAMPEEPLPLTDEQVDDSRQLIGIMDAGIDDEYVAEADDAQELFVSAAAMIDVDDDPSEAVDDTLAPHRLTEQPIALEASDARTDHIERDEELEEKHDPATWDGISEPASAQYLLDDQPRELLMPATWPDTLPAGVESQERPAADRISHLAMDDLIQTDYASVDALDQNWVRHDPTEQQTVNQPGADEANITITPPDSANQTADDQSSPGQLNKDEQHEDHRMADLPEGDGGIIHAGQPDNDHDADQFPQASLMPQPHAPDGTSHHDEQHPHDHHAQHEYHKHEPSHDGESDWWSTAVVTQFDDAPVQDAMRPVMARLEQIGPAQRPKGWLARLQRQVAMQNGEAIIAQPTPAQDAQIAGDSAQTDESDTSDQTQGTQSQPLHADDQSLPTATSSDTSDDLSDDLSDDTTDNAPVQPATTPIDEAARRFMNIVSEQVADGNLIVRTTATDTPSVDAPATSAPASPTSKPGKNDLQAAYLPQSADLSPDGDSSQTTASILATDLSSMTGAAVETQLSTITETEEAQTQIVDNSYLIDWLPDGADTADVTAAAADTAPTNEDQTVVDNSHMIDWFPESASANAVPSISASRAGTALAGSNADNSHLIEWLPEVADGNDHAKAHDDASCHVCNSSIAHEDEMMVCPECTSHYHAACWHANHGCATYGCAQVNALIKDDPQAMAAAAASRPAPASTSTTTTRSQKRARIHQTPTGEAMSWEPIFLACGFVACLAGLFTYGIPNLLVMAGATFYKLKRRRKPLSNIMFLLIIVLAIAATAAGVAFSQYFHSLSNTN